MSRITAYATIGEVKEGDTVRLDGGFTCIREGETRIVKRGAGGLYFECSEGNHYLDGQLDDGTEYIGVTLVAAEEAAQ